MTPFCATSCWYTCQVRANGGYTVATAEGPSWQGATLGRGAFAKRPHFGAGSNKKTDQHSTCKQWARGPGPPLLCIPYRTPARCLPLTPTGTDGTGQAILPQVEGLRQLGYDVWWVF